MNTVSNSLRQGETNFAPVRFSTHRILLGIAALACVGNISDARAELTWKEKTVEVKADAKATVVEARFPFTNGGPTAVDIQDIHNSCGCTTAALEKRHYESGQGGEIVAHYTVGEHTGVQRKTILVTTSDHPEATTLTLVTNVPELLHLEQTFVTWKHGEAPTTKALSLAVAPNTVALENLSVQPSNGAVVTEIQPAADGSGYEMLITPHTTDKAIFTTLIIRWRLGTNEKSYRAYATVEQATQPPRGEVPAARTPVATPSPKPLGDALSQAWLRSIPDNSFQNLRRFV